MKKKTKPISIASRKAKGRALQDSACDWVSRALDIPWGKDDDAEIRPRPMGQSGPDVILSKRVRDIFPFTIECKNQKRWSILEWIEQAKINCYTNTDWLLVMKRTGRKKEDRTDAVVVLDAETFFKLIEVICKLNTKK